MTSEQTAPANRILLIDDDRKFCQLVQEYLAPMGYDVACAYAGPSGLEMVKAGGFQAVILDVMLPGMDGFEVLKRLRRESDVPVLMLTSRGDEVDRIIGLEIGADDYLPKTFSTRELLARLRAVVRRAQQSGKPAAPAPETPIVVGDLRVEPAARAAWLAETPLPLTPIEFDILLCLARAPGRVLSRDRLLDAAAGRDYEVFDRSIDVHVSSLRRKLGDDPKAPRFIKTVRAAGYMFLDGAAAR
jgi:two-component system response regulator CpxR